MKHFFASILFLLSLFYFEINAQITLPVRSYNKIGLGEFNFSENTSTQSMGGLSTIYLSPTGTEVNFFNPAANGNLEDTAFNLSGSYDYVLYKNKAENSSFNQFNFDRISLGFPINKKIKAGIGFRQNSLANNDFYLQQGIGALDYSYNGGLNNFQSFVSYNLSKNFSLGLKAEYVFGNMFQLVNTKGTAIIGTKTVNAITYDVYESNSVETKAKVNMNNEMFTLGAYYKIPDKNKSAFLLGATYGIGSSINTKADGSLAKTTTYKLKDPLNNNTELPANDPNYPIEYSYIHTLTGTANQSEKLDPMQTFSFALGYEMQDKWMLGADFQWNGTGVYGDYSTDFSYQNRYRIALGGWWLPNKNGYKSYFQKVVYKGGVFFEQTPYFVDGQSIKDMGATVGFGLPVGKKNKSSINLGFEYIRRGTSNGLATQQDYFGLRLGLNFVNKWFNERLID